MGNDIKTSLVGKLHCPPKKVNDHVMTMRLPLYPGKKFATIISTYAPTMTNTDETKDKFYKDFEYVLSAVPAADKLIILGDFNARIGQDSTFEERYWVNTGPENATATTYCFFRPVPSII